MALMHSGEGAGIDAIDWERMVVKVADAIIALPNDSKRPELQSAIRRALMELKYRSSDTQPKFRQLFWRLYFRN